MDRMDAPPGHPEAHPRAGDSFASSEDLCRSPLRRPADSRRSRGHMSELDAERRRVLAVLHRHGWNATSFQVLEPGFRYWFAYVDTGRAWVAAGAPLTAPGRLPEVAERFRVAARAERRRIAFFGVEERLV